MGQRSQELDVLRKRACELHDRLSQRQQNNVPTAFVEFAGTPKSGKSTCIDIVSHFFKRTSFRVHAPTEGASKRTPYFLKEDLVAYNAWCASYALSHILEGVYGSDKFHLAILDRGLFDSLAWFKLLKENGEITQYDLDSIASFLMLKHWRQRIDCVFLFGCDDTTALQREYEHKLIDEPGVAMNPDLLQRLNEAYKFVQDKYSQLMPAVHNVDTSSTHETTPRTTALDVADKIMEVMEKKS